MPEVRVCKHWLDGWPGFAETVKVVDVDQPGVCFGVVFCVEPNPVEEVHCLGSGEGFKHRPIHRLMWY